MVLCVSCRRRTASFYCLTEKASFCLSCDYFCHSDTNTRGHIRQPVCDDCLYYPATLSCSIHRALLCQSCYSLGYNCATYGHHIQTISNNYPNQQNHQHVHVPQQPHNQQNVGDQRREGMFEIRCNGNNNCERWMYAVDCEACLAPNAVVYCSEEDYLLCNNCDRMFHHHQLVPPHMRIVLCVNCKRLSHNFLIGHNQFNLPST